MIERATKVSAALKWKNKVLAQDAQSERARRGRTLSDTWVGRSKGYVEDPHRDGDPLVHRLLRHVTHDMTVLDIGAGAGRYSLPIALHCLGLTAVEPSAAMAKEFLQTARKSDVKNVSVIREAWDKAIAPRADVVLTVHTIGAVAEAMGFIRKANENAAGKVIVVMDVDSPDSISARIWEQVYREPRCRLPDMRDLLDLLLEMGIVADVEVIPGRTTKAWDTFDEALQEFAHALFINGDVDLRKRLGEVLWSEVEEKYGQVHIAIEPPQKIAIISWKSG